MNEQHERLITAMCVWEELLEQKDARQEVLACFEAIGTNGVRYYAALWCEKVDTAWNTLTPDEQEASVPFDWEFVPAWLKENVDWSNPHLPTPAGGR
jgi:hypothetical protein